MIKKTTPWRDRPDSLQRGYVLGSATFGWIGVAAFLALALATGKPSALVASAIYLAIASFGTYMWYHG
jgi:hypothetical protein